jgi:hypothetical protein
MGGRKTPKGPIVIKEGTTTIIDSGILQTREWTPRFFSDEFRQLLEGAGGNLQGKQRRLQNIISGGSNTDQAARIEIVIPLKGISNGKAHSSIKTQGLPGQKSYTDESRVAAERALSHLDKFLAGEPMPTDPDKAIFLAGCNFCELMMTAEVLQYQQVALMGKGTQRRAAEATASIKTKSEQLHEQIREYIREHFQNLVDENPAKPPPDARKLKKLLAEARKDAKVRFGVSERTVYKATRK